MNLKTLPEDRPVLTVDAIVRKDDSILLIKRKNPPYGWALPGGLVDGGESVEDAVVRELAEETSLIATSFQFVGIASQPDRDPRFNTASVVYEITEYTGEAKAADDATECMWCPIKDIILGKVEMAFDHRGIVLCKVTDQGYW